MNTTYISAWAHLLDWNGEEVTVKSGDKYRIEVRRCPRGFIHADALDLGAVARGEEFVYMDLLQSLEDPVAAEILAMCEPI